MKYILNTLLLFTLFHSAAQNIPVYGPEIDVIVTGVPVGAMEPFISDDGNYMLFNNEISDKKIYYATRVNDSTFSFQGELPGVNTGGAPPYLDAVPDMDTNNYFVWTSMRDFPAVVENLHHGTFNAGSVSNIGRVYGDFYNPLPGWIAMDHGISADGQFLYYNNAYFDTCPGPCETNIGVAQKVNDSTFNKLVNSDMILANVNDTNYVSYATYISKNNLELYWTRIPAGAITGASLSEICVAVRSNVNDPFSTPTVLFSSPVIEINEAVSLSGDQMIMYYHKKVNGIFELKMRHRQSGLGISESQHDQPKTVVQIIDLMGRETEFKPNTLLIYIYSDGTTQKVFRAE